MFLGINLEITGNIDGSNFCKEIKSKKELWNVKELNSHQLLQTVLSKINDPNPLDYIKSCYNDISGVRLSKF